MDHETVRRDVHAGRLMPLSEILQRVRSHHPGRVLGIDLERDRSGRPHYEIVVMKPDGQRLRLDIDPATGAEIDREPPRPRRLLPMGEMLRGLLAAHPGEVRHAQLEQPSGRDARYDVRLLAADGSEEHFLVDGFTGEIIESATPPAAPASRSLPELIETFETRYRARAVEVKFSNDAPTLEIALELADGGHARIVADSHDGTVLHEYR